MQDIEIDINGSRELLQSLLHGLSQHLDLNAWVVVQSSHFVESILKVALLSKEIQLHCLLPGVAVATGLPNLGAHVT